MGNFFRLFVLPVLLIGGIVTAIALGGRAVMMHRIESDRRIDAKEGVATLDAITIGGVPQYVSIRGVNRTRPLLLWVHGGPGQPLMPLAHELNKGLETMFIVVHWDQRGAGLSNSSSVPRESITVERLADDLCELAEHLLARFQKEKLWLVAHDFGTVIAALAANKKPDLFAAYVGVGQYVDMAESERVAYEWAVQRATADGDSGAQAELEAIGPPPHDTPDESRRLRAMIRRLGGEVFNGDSVSYSGKALVSPEYSLMQWFRIGAGEEVSWRHLHGTWMRLNLLQDALRIDVPVYLFHGRHDRVAPVGLAAKYAKELIAPAHEIIFFESSGHWPFLEEPRRFQQMLLDHVLVRTGPK